jgi:hypothetical protein
VFKDLQKRNGTLSSQAEDNEKRMAESDWDNLYLPRYILDIFKRTGNCLLESAVKQLIGLSIIKADVIDIQRTTQL